MWWIDPEGYYSEDRWAEEDRLYSKCSHDWKPILLLTSTVYDCIKCGVKKEEYEKDIALKKK